MSAAIIAKEFAEWAARRMPPGATEAQREAAKLAFYSGFIACLVHQLNEVATLRSEAEAGARLEAIHNEGEDYLRTVDTPAPPNRTPPPRDYRHPRL
jgi:hypothetical protein